MRDIHLSRQPGDQHKRGGTIRFVGDDEGRAVCVDVEAAYWQVLLAIGWADDDALLALEREAGELDPSGMTADGRLVFAVRPQVAT